MTERIMGKIFLANGAGDSERQIDVLVEPNSSAVIEGEHGSLMIEAYLKPPKLVGKGNVWLLDGDDKVRSLRLFLEESRVVVISGTNEEGSYFEIGFVEYIDGRSKQEQITYLPNF